MGRNLTQVRNYELGILQKSTCFFSHRRGEKTGCNLKNHFPNMFSTQQQRSRITDLMRKGVCAGNQKEDGTGRGALLLQCVQTAIHQSEQCQGLHWLLSYKHSQTFGVLHGILYSPFHHCQAGCDSNVTVFSAAVILLPSVKVNTSKGSLFF